MVFVEAEIALLTLYSILTAFPRWFGGKENWNKGQSQYFGNGSEDEWHRRGQNKGMDGVFFDFIEKEIKNII